jgi:hypothetical protein
MKALFSFMSTWELMSTSTLALICDLIHSMLRCYRCQDIFIVVVDGGYNLWKEWLCCVRLWNVISSLRNRASFVLPKYRNVSCCTKFNKRRYKKQGVQGL